MITWINHPPNAEKQTTKNGGTLQNTSNRNVNIARMKSFTESIPLVQRGLQKAAIRRPTTEAFIPRSPFEIDCNLPKESQKGSTPKTRKKDGRKIAIRQIVAPIHPLGLDFMTVPKNAENVNKGPGTACAAPYPVINASFETNPVWTTSVFSRGKTTWPPPKTKEPERQKLSNIDKYGEVESLV